MKFDPSTWLERLVSMLQCEAAELIARLSTLEANEYAKVKATLLKNYRLSAVAFSQRFSKTKKKDSEGYPEFVYGMKTNIIEWLKSAEMYDSRAMVIETMSTL